MASAFAQLHRPGDPFILVNVWDIGTARLAAGMGAAALATSSAAQAFTLGRQDGAVTLDEALAHATDLARATDLPLSVDFEDGYAATPEGVAANTRRVAETGAAGLSIEDWDGTAAYAAGPATNRIAAAVAAKGDMVLCARADGVMNGVYDAAEAVRRCAAFAEAGADCLYVPMLPDAGALAEVVALGKPVNGLAAGPWLDWTQADWAAAGVARISLGSTLMRQMQRHLITSLGSMLGEGALPALRHAATNGVVDPLLDPPA